MKIIYPKNQVIKTTEIPNAFLFNRFSFGLLKLFLVTKSFMFFKMKYKHIKPVIKLAKSYKDFEIVNINTKKLPCIRIFRIQNSFISF